MRVLSTEEINVKYGIKSAFINQKSSPISPIKVKNVIKELFYKVKKSTLNLSSNSTNDKSVHEPKLPLKRLNKKPVVQIQNCMTSAHFPVKKCYIKLKRCDNVYKKQTLIPSDTYTHKLKIQIRNESQNDKVLNKLFDKYLIDDNEGDLADVEVTKKIFFENFGLKQCEPSISVPQNTALQLIQESFPLKEIKPNKNVVERSCENENIEDLNDSIEFIGEIECKDNVILEEINFKEITIVKVWSESLNEELTLSGCKNPKESLSSQKVNLELANTVRNETTPLKDDFIIESTKDSYHNTNKTDRILTEIPTNLLTDFNQTTKPAPQLVKYTEIITNQERSLTNNQTTKSPELVKYSCSTCNTFFDTENELKIHKIFHERKECQNVSTEKILEKKRRKSVSLSSTVKKKYKFICPYKGCKILLSREELKKIGDKHLLRVHAAAPSNKLKWIETSSKN